MLICHRELVSLCAPRSWGSCWGDKGLHKVGSGGNNHPIGYESSTAQTGHPVPCGSKLHMQHHVVVSHVDSTYPKGDAFRWSNMVRQRLRHIADPGQWHTEAMCWERERTPGGTGTGPGP
jgi:hypothetical protein